MHDEAVIVPVSCDFEIATWKFFKLRYRLTAEAALGWAGNFC